MRNREIRAKSHSIELFKYFVQFLEIFGQENYGGSAEVNWPAVYEFCSSYDIFSFNQELEDIVYAEKEEEFRDKAFEYVEKQILDGYPVWRLFHMSKWLYDQFEKELADQENKKDIEYFNKTRCYRCKHYKETMEYYTKNGYPMKIRPGEMPKDLMGHEVDPRTINMIHWRSCDVRDKQYKELEDKSNSRFETFKFEYKRFNSDEMGICGRDQRKWKLIPWELKRCPYFEDSGITFNEFIKLYFECCRLYKED